MPDPGSYHPFYCDRSEFGKLIYDKELKKTATAGGKFFFGKDMIAAGESVEAHAHQLFQSFDCHAFAMSQIFDIGQNQIRFLQSQKLG